MIDFHSHVLPGIDDGSSCVDESLDMLRIAKNQGVSTMLATPHFYAQNTSVGHFLEKRERALHELNKSMEYIDTVDYPNIKLGAEVCYFNGIGQARDLENLCMEGTNSILLELPFIQWDKLVLQDVNMLIEERKLNVILAHIERFYAFQKRKKIWKEIMELPVIFQINADFFDNRKKRKVVNNLIVNDKAVILGSDCHNVERRKPNLNSGYDYIADKYGKDVINKINNLGTEVLENDIKTDRVLSK